MATGGVEVQRHPVPLSGYAEVTAAFQIVRNVLRSNLKWQANILDTILYGDSVLARPLPRTGYVGENEVLRKNVYYLATKTQNVSDELILTLVDADVLTVEEGNLILQQPTNKLRAVKLYALIVEKEDPDNSIASTIVSALHAHENVEVTRIFLEQFNLNVPNIGTGAAPANEVDLVEQEEPEPDPDPVENNNEDHVEGAQARDAVEIIQEGQWQCRFCTFINNTDVNICEVCSKTEDFNLNDSLEVCICPQCTLINEAELESCEACGFAFMREIPAEENDPHVSADNEDQIYLFDD